MQRLEEGLKKKISDFTVFIEPFLELQDKKPKGLYVDTPEGFVSSPRLLKENEVMTYLSEAQKWFEKLKKVLLMPLTPCVKAYMREAIKSSSFEEIIASYPR